jgi:hypothetical protein
MPTIEKPNIQNKPSCKLKRRVTREMPKNSHIHLKKLTIAHLSKYIISVALLFVFLATDVYAEQKRWILLWATHYQSNQLNLINIHQQGASYQTLNECHEALREDAFYQKEHNDNWFFRDLEIKFINSERLVASVEYENGSFNNFLQSSCIEIKMD